MKNHNLRRDPLDYLLTDTTPVEISELFTYTYLYSYLHKNQNKLAEILDIIRTEEVNKFGKGVPFNVFRRQRTNAKRKWLSNPLTYSIMKSDGKSKRKMSIPQPLAALNIYFFIHLYQRDILNILEDAVFSVRYHTRNSDLVYKRKGRRALIDYQYRRNRRSKKIIEQTGRFFDIQPYTHAIEVTRSEKWRQANIRFSLFCKLDFKRCFDSIYTHAFKWIISRDVVDSKSFQNSSLFAVIDRILQNINGASSNGVLVGPEFSRMIVEILMQQIDKEVFFTLTTDGLRQGVDFEIIRFVDDIYVFCNNKNVETQIKRTIEEKSQQYLLELNEQKAEFQNTPYFSNTWIDTVDQYKEKIQLILRSNKTIAKAEGESYQISGSAHDISHLKSQFEHIVSTHKSSETSITNYVLSVITNSLASKGSRYKFFKSSTHKVIPPLLDYVFYVYCHAINFKNTQKLISILYYFHHEINLNDSSSLQKVIHKYEQTIVKANYSDYVNLLTAFDELSIHFSLNAEEHIYHEIQKADDPIALAAYWSYCKYNQRLMEKVTKDANLILGEKLAIIRSNAEELQYREFWYVLIFNKCPYIHKGIQQSYTHLLRQLKNDATPNPSDLTIKLIAEFMTDPKETYSFISWNLKGARMLEEITYRTHNKTVFQHGSASIIASL